MKKQTIIVLIIVLMIIGGLLLLVDRSVNDVVSAETKDLVEEYVKKEYKIDCKVKSSSFSHYEEGITGGLYMYDFVCVDKKFKEIKISYRAYADLNRDTLENLEVEK